MFSERSGVVVEPAEFAGIAAEAGPAGVKLSGLAAERFEEYHAALPPEPRLWSGAGTRLAEVVRHGGAGVVSGLSAAFPEPFAMPADAVASGDPLAERTAQARADEVLAALGGTVEGIKPALSHVGRGTGGALRMPASEIGPDERRHIARLAETAQASHIPR
ncbi:dihydrodipicolinate synthase family protein [Nonomuraea aurantiaca]|uniref:dihydrodipicolinate synthase family protein n=1 Tax=Nonomuraea aurantiaca TaxID=2878562 RepID=UPI001CDA498E|nr:dihydrodipicolinate synthase family protein [Nonomuraea aurantiaca]MCA2221932.1 dihydrodipicolinate synthase family protein [Nonomuraea aurantiaca]